MYKSIQYASYKMRVLYKYTICIIYKHGTTGLVNTPTPVQAYIHPRAPNLLQNSSAPPPNIPARFI